MVILYDIGMPVVQGVQLRRCSGGHCRRPRGVEREPAQWRHGFVPGRERHIASTLVPGTVLSMCMLMPPLNLRAHMKCQCQYCSRSNATVGNSATSAVSGAAAAAPGSGSPQEEQQMALSWRAPAAAEHHRPWHHHLRCHLPRLQVPLPWPCCCASWAAAAGPGPICQTLP